MNFDPRGFNDDHFVVAFGGPASTIDVYTVSEALTGLADALRAINEIVNPDIEFEIEIEGTGDGSFLVKLRTKKTYRTILRRVVEPIVLGLLVNYMYEQATYQKPTYTIQGDELILETSKESIRLPKSIFDHKQKVDGSPAVARGVKKAVEAVQQDEAIKSIGVAQDLRSPVAVEIPRQEFDRVISQLEKFLILPGQHLLEDVAVPRETSRKLIKRTQLVIIKAVLKRSRRKWQFNWAGFDVSASITDPTFFDRLETRQISISQGDALDVDLSVSQIYDSIDRVWRNVGYEVVRVYGLIEGAKQDRLEFPKES